MVKILIYLKVWLLKLIPGLYSKQEDNYYDAYEKDIAVVHFFFQVAYITVIIIILSYSPLKTLNYLGANCIPV